MRSKVKYGVFGLLLSGLMAGACSSDNAYYDQYQTIPDQTWSSANVLEYNVEVDDTLKPYQFFLNIRHSGDYAYSNIYFFLDTDFPNGKSSRDTIECVLAQPSGKWNGTGLGDLYEGKYVIKYAKRFPLMGDYTFKVTQAMREDPLLGISDVGFRLESYIKEEE